MTGVTRSREWEGLDRSLAFRVDGERGWFLFRGYVEREDGVAWVDGYGPVGPHGKFRSFDPSRVRRSCSGLVLTKPAEQLARD